MTYFTKKEKKGLLQKNPSHLDQKIDGEFKNKRYLPIKNNRLFSPKTAKKDEK